MGPELLSTARPSRLRVGSFLALTLGGALVALGSLLDWATVRPFGTPTRGIDLWEGKVALALGIAVLVGMVAMRTIRTRRGREVAAIVLLVLGLAATLLAGLDVAWADDRFTSPDQRDRIARAVADQLGRPYPDVRAAIERQFDLRFAVTLEPGIWLVLVGGILAAVGGGLSVAWAREAGAPSHAEPPGGDEPSPGDEPAPGNEPLSGASGAPGGPGAP